MLNVPNSRLLISVVLAATVCLALYGSPARAETDAPNFTLEDLEHKRVSLSDYRGKVVLVNFWATWCAPCKREMPHLEKMYNEFKEKGFEVVSISTDSARGASKVKSFIKQKKYTFTVLLDTESKVLSQYNPSKSVPYTVLIDRQGQIQKRFEKYTDGDEVEMRREVKKLVENGL